MMVGIIVLILIVAGLAVWYPMHCVFYGSTFFSWATAKAENIFRILVVAVTAILLDLIIGTWMNNPVVLGIGFVAALAIFFALWTPTGFVLAKLGIIKKVYSEFIGGAFFWLAFAGFIRMCFPKVSSGTELMLGTIIFWVLNASFNVALARKSTLPIRLAMAVVIIMATGAVIKIIVPDTFVSWDSYLTAQRKSIDERRNQKTMVLAARAKMMTRVAERESSIYENKAGVLTLVADKVLEQNQVAMVVKDTVTGMPIEVVVEGETFVKIQLLNAVGTFSKGDTFYVQPQIFRQGNYEVYPSEYVPEYVLSKNGKIWKVISMTDKPFKIEDLPISKKFFKISGGNYQYSSDGQNWDMIKPDESRKTDSSIWLSLASGESVDIRFM